MVVRLQNSSGATLDIQAVVDFFGGRQALVAALKQHEIVVLSVPAVAKWVLRGHIPAARVHDLQTLARLTRKDFALVDFVSKGPKKKVA